MSALTEPIYIPPVKFILIFPRKDRDAVIFKITLEDMTLSFLGLHPEARYLAIAGQPFRVACLPAGRNDEQAGTC